MTLDNFDFKFNQCFGDKTDIVVTEADIITSVQFDHSGSYLATGDRGGRVVLFERDDSKHCEYKFMTEFQSHDAEFDYLKSLEIEEKINQIKWLKPIQRSHFLLSTNDKTIKLWKVYEKTIKLVSENNLSEGSAASNYGAGAAALYRQNGGNGILQPKTKRQNQNLSLDKLKLPRLSKHDKIIAAAPKRIYANAHTYHINSISPSSDQETFISSDDLRINLWNLDIPDQSFNIVDIKPVNMEELTEVITSAEFHPQYCNLFMYSSSKGTVKLCDMRQNALCDNKTMTFEEYLDPINHNFFTEITSSISDIKFSPNGRYIASRDYLTVKIWDINMNNKPLKTINIHENLKDRLSDTYENDAIFDKFEVNFGGDSSSIMTGSYNNKFMVYPDAVKKSEYDTYSYDNDVGVNKNGIVNEFDSNAGTPEEIVLQADKSAFRNKRTSHNSTRSKQSMISDINNDIDFKKSILHFSWHPTENSIAIAATNNLFIFSAL